MDLRRIRHFNVLAETLNFSRAAERLHIAQPALSVSMQKLETELGTRLFERTLDYFHRLEIYIAAGDERLRRLDTETIPAMTREVEASKDVLKAQELADLRAKRDDLERRVHDLKLTRQVTMQSLPSIRIVQQNDSALVAKIESTMANTIPLWRQQLAMAVTIAVRAVKPRR